MSAEVLLGERSAAEACNYIKYGDRRTLFVKTARNATIGKGVRRSGGQVLHHRG